MKKRVNWDEVRAQFDPERRARNHVGSVRKIDEYQQLRSLRRALKLTQADLASRLGIAQSEISRLERRSDMLVSTLRDYVRALDGELEITIRLPSGRGRVTSLHLTLDEPIRNVAG